MNLSQLTAQALDLTQRLQAALGVGDMDMCQDILVLRGQAMQAFEAAHRQAPEAERSACATTLAELAAADRALQEISSRNLESVARDFRENLVTSQSPPSQSGYTGQVNQACIDRKA